MKKVITKSFDKSISTGAVTQLDFSRWGHVYVTFLVNKATIGVEISGFCSKSVYYINPKNTREREINSWFVERYVNKCLDPQELKGQIGIK